MILYHVTDIENLESISQTGLIPSIGRLSSKYGETIPQTYFFSDPEDVVTALMNWLGVELDEIDEIDGFQHKHVVLECRANPTDIDPQFFEVTLAYTIPPQDIRITTNPDLFVDFDYDETFIAQYPTLCNWD